jgi:hypothetical protein
MGQQNFAAGLEMTIGRVVRNYLRWFELNKYKRTLAKSPENRGTWFRSWSARKNAVPHSKPIQGEDGSESHGRESAANNPQAIDFVDPFA